MILISFSAFGQEELHSRKKKAIEAYEKARSLIIMGQNIEASKYLREAIDKDKSFDEAISLLMQVYLEKGDKTQALNLYANGIEELDSDFRSKIDYNMAKFFWLSAEYERAQAYVDKINGVPYNVIPQDVELLKKSVAYALEENKDEGNLVFEHLQAQMNLFDRQYFPSLDASGQLVFTARDKKWGGDEQILVTRDSAGSWAEPKMISDKLNSGLNEGTASISADGKTLVFTGCNRPNGAGSCDLYVSYKEQGEWLEPEILPNEVNSRFWESQPSLSSNGQSLYFVSTRPGKGGQDLWVTNKVDGQWTNAIALDAINTAKDDASPFIYPDDITLFFASNGRPGLGRFDLFRTQKDENSWTSPENLGSPINDEQDQIGYSVSIDGWAYFSTTLGSGRIVMKRFKFPERLLPKVEFKNIQVTLVDSLTGEKLKGSVTVAFDAYNIALEPREVGVYEGLIKGEMNQVYAEVIGYRPKQQTIAKPSTEIELLMAPMMRTFDPIYFGLNKYQLSSTDLRSLEELASYLKENPHLKLNLVGFTDSVGSSESNLVLAQRRVDAVLDQLKDFSVRQDRIISKVRGEQLANAEVGDNANSKHYRKVEIEVIVAQRPRN